MKIVYLTDIHVTFKNLVDVDALMERIESFDANNPFDACVIAGDTLDTHEKINTQLMNKAYALIDILRHRCRVVYVIVGNHDYINNQQYCSDAHWLNALKEWTDVVVVDKPTFIDDGRIVVAPYVYNGRFVESLNEYVPNWRCSAKCIFAHQEFKGVKMGCVVSQTGDDWSAERVRVISGHVHDTQRVGEYIYYPGSTLTHSYVDRNNAGGIKIFTFDEDCSNYDEITIPIENVRRKTLKRLAARDIIDDDESDKRLKIGDGDKIKIYGSKDDVQRCKRLLKKRGDVKYVVVAVEDIFPKSLKSFDEILADLVDGDEDLLNDLRKLKEDAYFH